MAKEKKRRKPTLIGFQIEHFVGACLDMTRKVGEPNVNSAQMLLLVKSRGEVWVESVPWSSDDCDKETISGFLKDHYRVNFETIIDFAAKRPAPQDVRDASYRVRFPEYYARKEQEENGKKKVKTRS